jgi:ribonuclease VapC
VILDSSAILAVLFKEPGHELLLEHLTENPEPGVGAPTLVESGIVLAARLGASGETLLARFVQAQELTVIAFGEEHWPIAVQAFLSFGKGRHPAALNFGDCLTYAIARLAGEPLLCVGEDFAKTDLELVD